MESMRYEGLRGRTIFKEGSAANVSGIMVWFILKLKNYIQEDGIFLNGLFGFYVSLASG
jgi:hypothetical protein